MSLDLDATTLVATARALVAGDRGLLAIDESVRTCDARFSRVGIPQTPDRRRAYRELIVTTPRLAQSISGVILADETIRQRTSDGRSFVGASVEAGLIPGVKVDLGAKPLAAHPGETVTEGLDGLRERLQTYVQLGARFAKWRAVLSIGKHIPSAGCVEANAHALARYASLCQESAIVPVVETDVLMDGDHSLAKCGRTTESVLHALFVALRAQGVLLEGMILKPSMVVPGIGCAVVHSSSEIADATVECLLRTVPAAVPGVTFLSGGQSGPAASERLNAMNLRFRGRLPWALSFSFARAIQQPAMELWNGEDSRAAIAQEALSHRARCDAAARRGEYDARLDTWSVSFSQRVANGF
jgi:fructose-bisphosphate aldolase class I